MNKKQKPKHIQADCSKFETNRWVVILSRRLTPEELTKVGEFIDGPEAAVMGVYDKKGEEFSLPVTLWCIQQVCPDVTARNWHAEPMNVLVHGLHLPQKVYEIKNAMSFKEADRAARETWFEQFKNTGQAAIFTSRLATQRDMRKMVEAKDK